MGTEVMALREALVREATARVKAEAESATLRAARDRAEAVCKALCGPSGFARSAAIWLRGNDMPSAASALEAWAAGKGERPAVKCGECRHSLPSREATHFPLRCGLDTELYMGTEWTCPKGKPKPAPEPAKPKCGKCGGHPLVDLMSSGLCFVCDTEASRVAGLRARLVELLNKDNVPVRSYHSGNTGLCIGVEDDNAVVEAAGVPGRFRWALRTLIILVPEGESHE